MFVFVTICFAINFVALYYTVLFYCGLFYCFVLVLSTLHGTLRLVRAYHLSILHFFGTRWRPSMLFYSKWRRIFVRNRVGSILNLKIHHVNLYVSKLS